MSENQEIEDILKRFQDGFKKIYFGANEEIGKLFLIIKEDAREAKSIDAFKRKLKMNFLKELIYMIKNDEVDHNDFYLEELKKSDFWRPIAKLILLKRINELKNCHVEKKGKKFDVSQLRETYFGKFIMDKLKFSRRSVLNEDEYDRMIKAIKKLNYEVPVVIQPTETEKFFD